MNRDDDLNAPSMTRAAHIATGAKVRAAHAADWLAVGIIIAATLITSLAQYEVDYEVTLLPWLLSRGWIMYRDVVDQHPPLLPTLLAAGGGDPGPLLHALVALQHLALLSLTYLVARRLFGWGAGLFSLALVEAWSVALDSMRLWYDSVLGLLYLLVLFVIAGTDQPAHPGEERHSDRRFLYRSLVCGLLLAVALLIKQHALVALPFVFAAVVWGDIPRVRARSVVAFLAGFALPLVLTALLLLAGGALSAAWYWIVEYSLTSSYASDAARRPGPDEWWRLVSFLLPAVAACLLLMLRRRAAGGEWRVKGNSSSFPFPSSSIVALSGFLLSGSLLAWPRYAPFHLQAAVPVISILAGFVFARAFGALRTRRVKAKLVAAVALALLGISALAGASGWVRMVQTYLYIGPASAPYAESIAPLRAWVSAHGAGSPVFIYDLDPLLYRALAVEPPRPWAPQLPWILEAQDTRAALWAGVENARPPVALAPAGAWDAVPLAGPEYGLPRLRRDYREGGRFLVTIYSQTPAVEIVGLLRSDVPNR